MKNLLFILLGVNLLTAKEIEVSLSVMDHTEKTIPDAQCVIQYNRADSGKVELIKGPTNTSGTFSAKLNTLESLYIEVNKPDYYQSRLYDISGSQNLAQTVKLIPKLHPIPLYVRHHSGNNSESLKVSAIRSVVLL